MKKLRLLGVVLACTPYFISMPVTASVYSITFYERVDAGDNIFTDFNVFGAITFGINDTAAFANNLVLFSDSNFLAFDASMNTTAGDAQFMRFKI